ncbi:conserved hypothetical protein [Flavobacterium sp. 9AF]|uniref:DUF1016 N-terminal domain-containing protein n=1 Tax=Flavobacterium sp. 9AF TaxID=2653142 RepID=UPI0012F40C22|nr:DUF1016 N-terminal domain-containing protein [Flavobacterium sp. 9AF]VXC19814.1 conserved hypothetical protein [Flavobacterium sp. 9AF]
MKNTLQNRELFQQVVDLLQNARQQVLRTVNSTMVYTYFEIGRIIVEEEQKGKERAEYGKQLLKGLSEQLKKEFGKGFSVDNLQNMRKLFLIYSNYETASSISENSVSKSETVSSNSNLINSDYKFAVSFILTWSHYVFLLSIDDEKERKFYEIESIKNKWSVRELRRQYDTALYTRLSLSRDKEGILKLSEEGQIIEKPKDIIKDPYILEFLGLQNAS